MTNEVQRKEIQQLVDRHQNIIQMQVDLHRRYQTLNYRFTPEIQAEYDRLIAAEATARADCERALVGWDEPILVTPVR